MEFPSLSKIFLVIFFILETGSEIQGKWHEEKYTHQVKDLSDNEFRHIALNQVKSPSFESLLDPMLIPRVPGTPNHAAVNKFIKDHMQNLGWSIETDAFSDNTPHGVKPFENIIATLNPNIQRRLVLACHYDSKYSKENDFIGATDSAVPCAMMIHLAYSLQNQMNAHRNLPVQNVTLQLLFFDGEEAFNFWSDTDSIYGARHLAEKWEKTPFPPGNRAGTNELHRMDVMVLLDLLGVKNSKFYSFFQETNHIYSKIFESEQALRKNKFWNGRTDGQLFRPQFSYAGIEDDHIPFVRRGVDIVHVIPSPFPKVWHTPQDNKAALDFPTIDNLNKILRVFVARYLHLPHDSS